MSKVNNLFQDKQQVEFEKAYAEHLKDNDPADVLSETDFAEYWEMKNKARDFGVSN